MTLFNLILVEKRGTVLTPPKTATEDVLIR